ncbi:MAG: hypothetical protein A3F82_08065 [Deltaproteobacteria bacterium RIFCSPLOWO2_12_FULL_44_12]|nr:MAG: hypothetical protein A2712_07205 [Deltaproteobacteria bacterium RIFCSPHIGHO2_01_FULL_43_49]OGQ15734.1 MAG: hypothetical protein A3D22_05995 [Deltaproteobacteria bacterium RIFCSPHIGHO2_02_FULL_44_53]OGQ28703.1 MAG: hypothetical protein A3D98_00730 [Deltaproteobacteria bacterium RIFCSPHIGHO2_12_FULL_44_21]OGQ32026.1 MAG: hypothetical protein A2979_02940 [Deltaproteobacteria bacterium RIFCSPLOWO2_01_FULL_45_74]OGQ43639.1 MAG: hypothetical protein A3I70_03455 [Deltaproteobacteria bacterium 
MSSIILILLFLGLMGLIVTLWIRERKYLKKKTSETMRDEVWQEVVKEREEALEKRRHFRDILNKTKSRLK